MRYGLASLAFLALVALVPLASACEGLSPGDELLAGGSRCTLAFLLADVTGLYFATAGHCIDENETASSPGVGAFGVGFLHYLNPENGRTDDGAPGEDFGLILIDEAFYDKLNPKMCAFDGPIGIYEQTPGSGGVKHHGYGLILGDAGPTRARQGFNLHNNNTAFYWTGAGVPGDSGSSVLSADNRALGVLTHLQAGVGTTDTNGGTHLYRGLQLAKEMKGLDLRLVLKGEDPREVIAQLRAGETTGSAPQPTTTTPAVRSDAGAPSGNSTRPSATPPPRAQPAADPLAPAAGAPQDAPAQTPGAGLLVVGAAMMGTALARRRRA